MERREVKTNWKELLKAFVSSDEKLEQENKEEEIEFNREYSKILSESRSDISSLEAMLEHPDVKVKGKGRRPRREQTRLTTKERAMDAKGEKAHEEDREIER